MKPKRKHRRLRKQVIMCIPIILLIITLSTILIIKKNKNLNGEANVLKSQTASATTLEGTQTSSYVESINNLVYNRKRNNTVIYYAQKFKLNVDKTLELVRNFTNDYTSELYLKNFIIGPVSIQTTKEPFASEEAGIAYFIRDLYRYPQKYGTSIEEIRASDETSIERMVVDGKIYVDNGMTYEQYLGKICDLFAIDKNIVLAISYMETGYLKSNLFNYKNNVGGHRGSSGWLSYPTLEAGIIAHALTVKAITDNYNIDSTSENAISELSSIYVNGHPDNPDEHWTSKVTLISNQIKEKDLFTIS